MSGQGAGAWVAVARSRDVGRRPVQRWLDGRPLVLFRSGGKVQALADRCPHRMAELSGGRVRDGAVECPYHGWRFSGDGRCVGMPGLIGDVPAIRVRSFQVHERGGVVFVSGGNSTGSPYLHGAESADVVTRIVTSSTDSTLVDVAENILDATHTHFTHRGVLRGLSQTRYRVRVDVTGGDDWVEARYEGEERQHGLISRLLEGARSYTVGRFRHPGIAELEFHGPSGLALATTFHLRQAVPGRVDGIGLLAGPRQHGLGHLKALLFMPLFRIALWQDRRILSAASRNAARFGAPQPVVGPLDFLRRDIERITGGERPLAADAPCSVVIEL